MSPPRARALALLAALLAVPAVSRAEPSPAPAVSDAPRPADDAPAGAGPSATSATPAGAPGAAADASRGAIVRSYHDALARRRLGSQVDLTLEEVTARAAEGEGLVREGRLEEAVARLVAVVEHPRFSLYEDGEPGRAALYALGDALATAGAYEPARAYLRRGILAKGAWDGRATYARRSAKRLVEIALETRAWAEGARDLEPCRARAPEEIRAELAYVEGRAKEAAGERDAALAAYGRVPQGSRFGSQALYLAGLLELDRGRPKEAEALFCKVADPKRQDRSAPVLADERFFAVRDLARLALGRVAHEQGRHDDARYYYYLVPQDSDRLAEALYESATTRYEKKDYEGARELLDELRRARVHHRYEDEAEVLSAWVDLARCRFDDADRTLRAFLARYGPVRAAAGRIAKSEGATRAMVEVARTQSAPTGTEAGGVPVEDLRTVAALLRVDPLLRDVVKRRAVLERQRAALGAARAQVDDLARGLATNGGVRPALAAGPGPAELSEDARLAVDGARRDLDALDAAGAPRERVAQLRGELEAVDVRLRAGAPGAAEAAEAASTPGADLPELLLRDRALGARLAVELDRARAELDAAEVALARAALSRLELRLGRLLRRARLGRIETVLGRKRGLEVEVEGIRAGYLPRDAVDSLDAARYLGDREEYWPFEGDDWADEFVGSEVVR